jgi:signal transduction histidine kinase
VPAANAVWGFFLAAVLSVAIVVAAFATALVIAQRRREALRSDYARRILQAHEQERAWIAGELHDDALQRVAVLRHELDRALSRTSPDAAPPPRIAALGIQLQDLAVTIRDLARRLHPDIVDKLGLARALEALADEMGRSEDLQVILSLDGGTTAIPPTVAHEAYRLAQEALRNAARHSGADTARLEMAVIGGQLRLRIEDAGCGFAPREVAHADGLGLVSMRERAAYIGGKLTVRTAPGRGTLIEALLPIEER